MGGNGPLEDPMADAVSAAKLTIPQAVGDTIKQLGWAEYAGLDPYAALEYERAVRSRIDPDGRFRNAYLDRVLGPVA